MEIPISIRFCRFSENLHKKLLELGYEESRSEGRDLDLYRIFIRGERQVWSSYRHLLLLDNLKPTDNLKELQSKGMIFRNGMVIRYHGLSISEELLKFFSTRENFNIQ